MFRVLAPRLPQPHSGRRHPIGNPPPGLPELLGSIRYGAANAAPFFFHCGCPDPSPDLVLAMTRVRLSARWELPHTEPSPSSRICTATCGISFHSLSTPRATRALLLDPTLRRSRFARC